MKIIYPKSLKNKNKSKQKSKKKSQKRNYNKMVEESKKIEPHQNYNIWINNKFPKLKANELNNIDNILIVKDKTKENKNDTGFNYEIFRDYSYLKENNIEYELILRLIIKNDTNKKK